MKNYFNHIPILAFIITLFSTFSYPSAIPILGLIALLFSLAFALYNIFKKTKNSRIQIAKEILIFIATLILISFLGGVAGLFVNAYVSPMYGLGIGLLCAMLVSFGVGYLVRRGVRRLTK